MQPKDTPDEPTSTPTKLPNIVKPSQQNPDRITDTGTGEYSKFRKQKHLKNISDEDFKWILIASNNNRKKAEMAVINYSESILRGLIKEKKREAGVGEKKTYR